MRMHFELVLEVASGCRYNCTGCQVEKENNRIPTEAEFDRLDEMVASLKSNGMDATDLILGPTDILSADNREEFMSHPRMAKLASNFRRLLVNTAFLSKDEADYVWLADKVSKMIPGGTVCSVSPFEIKHLYNEKYIEVLKKRIVTFRDNLVNIDYPKVYTTVAVNFDDYLPLGQQTIRDARVIKLHSYANGDLILPHGRKGFKTAQDIEDFHKSVDLLTDAILTSTHVSRTTDSASPDLNEFRPGEGTGASLSFRNGSLYFRPFLVEAFDIFHPRFQMSDEWNFEGVYEHHEERIIKGLTYASEVKDCSDCPMSYKCAERGALAIMEHTGRKTCITGAKRYPELRVWNSPAEGYVGE